MLFGNLEENFKARKFHVLINLKTHPLTIVSYKESAQLRARFSSKNFKNFSRQNFDSSKIKPNKVILKILGLLPWESIAKKHQTKRKAIIRRMLVPCLSLTLFPCNTERVFHNIRIKWVSYQTGNKKTSQVSGESAYSRLM